MTVTLSQTIPALPVRDVAAAADADAGGGTRSAGSLGGAGFEFIGAKAAGEARRRYRAYGLLACNETVLVERPFPLELGLSKDPSDRPDSSYPA